MREGIEKNWEGNKYAGSKVNEEGWGEGEIDPGDKTCPLACGKDQLE